MNCWIYATAETKKKHWKMREQKKSSFEENNKTNFIIEWIFFCNIKNRGVKWKKNKSIIYEQFSSIINFY